MTRFGKFIGAACLAALAPPAFSLSCVPPDVARTYQQLHAAPETYVVVHGTLTFDETGLPEGDFQNQLDNPPSTKLPARLSGRALSRAGFVTPFDRQITLDVLCYGPWCAGGASGTDVLAFVERRASGYVLTLDPCNSWVFTNPTRQHLDQAESCMRGGPCTPRDY